MNTEQDIREDIFYISMAVHNGWKVCVTYPDIKRVRMYAEQELDALGLHDTAHFEKMLNPNSKVIVWYTPQLKNNNLINQWRAQTLYPTPEGWKMESTEHRLYDDLFSALKAENKGELVKHNTTSLSSLVYTEYSLKVIREAILNNYIVRPK